MDAIADTTTSPYPHMMPSNELFVSHMKRLKIRKNDYIVCFDHMGSFSVERVWYTFITFGATNVRVLDGGLPLWKSRHNEVTPAGSGTPPPSTPDEPDSYAYSKDLKRIMDIKQIHELVPQLLAKTVPHCIVDARSADRFAGTVAEPRAGLRRGCIPGSINTPFKELLNADGCTMKSKSELAAYFKHKGIKLSRPIIGSCGSGMTACIPLFAAYRLGAKNISLYDGSWAEYVIMI